MVISQGKSNQTTSSPSMNIAQPQQSRGWNTIHHDIKECEHSGENIQKHNFIISGFEREETFWDQICKRCFVGQKTES